MTATTAPPVLAPILARLKLETAAAHERVESTLALLVDPALDRDAYARVLAAFLGYYAAIEPVVWSPALAPALAALGLHAAERTRTPLLERDLRALGLDDAALAALPRSACVPDVRGSVSRALGVLYVLEGATLGGRVIARHVARSVGATGDDGGAAFFAGDGERTGALWSGYRAAVTRHVERETGERASVERAIVGAAAETFASLGRWMEDALR